MRVSNRLKDVPVRFESGAETHEFILDVDGYHLDARRLKETRNLTRIHHVLSLPRDTWEDVDLYLANESGRNYRTPADVFRKSLSRGVQEIREVDEHIATHLERYIVHSCNRVRYCGGWHWRNSCGSYRH